MCLRKKNDVKEERKPYQTSQVDGGTQNAGTAIEVIVGGNLNEDPQLDSERSKGGQHLDNKDRGYFDTLKTTLADDC